MYTPARMLDAEKVTRDPTRARDGPARRGTAATIDVTGPIGSPAPPAAASATGATTALSASIVSVLTMRHR